MFDVITIGSATQDVFLRSDSIKVLNDPKHLKKLGFIEGKAECFALGSKISLQKPVFSVGGGATNAAVTFKRQGLKTGTVISLGKDIGAQLILDKLEEDKIKAFVQSNKKLSTAYSTVLLTKSGERTALVYRGASDELDDKKFVFKRARWVYITPGEIKFAVINRIIDQYKKKKTKIAINPSRHYLKMDKRKLNGLFKKVDVVILNRIEASILTGKDISDEKGIFKAFDKAIGGLAVMTDGNKGVSVSDGETIYKAGIFKEKVSADRTGAGDAFGSGLISALIQKKSLEEAIRVGSANATSVIEHVGAKKGVLHKKDLSVARWRKLTISKKKL